MGQSLRLTIVFEEGDGDWVIASIPEVPGALSQGRTRAEARANVIDAMWEILAVRLAKSTDETVGVDRESVELVVAG